MSNRLTNILNSFITNTAPLRSKLYQWGIITTNSCHYHPGIRETPEHFIFDCDNQAILRSSLKKSITEAIGSPDLTCKNIITSPQCARLLAESIGAHFEDSKPLNDGILFSNQNQ